MMKTYKKLITLIILIVAISAHADVPEGLTGTLIVLNKGGNDASFIDLASGQLVATLPTGKGPHELVISADGQRAISTDYGGGDSLTVFDIATPAVQRTIDFDHQPNPHGMLLLPGRNEVIVTSEKNRTVALVDFVSGETRHVISTEQSGSHMVAISEDGSTAFTANGGSDSVSVIDLQQKKFVKALDVPSRPEAITSNKAGDQVWVGSNNTGLVSVISVADGSILAQWDGFTWPYRVLLTDDENFALIPDMRKGELRIFDVKSKTELGRIDLPSAGPQGMALYSDDRTLFLSLSAQDKVVVIGIVSRLVIGEYPAGSSPDGIGFSSVVVKP